MPGISILAHTVCLGTTSERGVPHSKPLCCDVTSRVAGYNTTRALRIYTPTHIYCHRLPQPLKHDGVQPGFSLHLEHPKGRSFNLCFMLSGQEMSFGTFFCLAAGFLVTVVTVCAVAAGFFFIAVVAVCGAAGFFWCSAVVASCSVASSNSSSSMSIFARCFWSAVMTSNGLALCLLSGWVTGWWGGGEEQTGGPTLCVARLQ